MRGSTVNDAGVYQYTQFKTLSDERHYIELEWQAASGVGANNGSLTLWLDGVPGRQPEREWTTTCGGSTGCSWGR